jgi:type I restriction enzyme, R subunit
MSFTESIVEDTTLNWFGELDYALLHGQEIAPGEAAAERASFAEAFLPDRLRAALRKLNPKLPGFQASPGRHTT